MYKICTKMLITSNFLMNSLVYRKYILLSVVINLVTTNKMSSFFHTSYYIIKNHINKMNYLNFKVPTPYSIIFVLKSGKY